MEKHSEENKLIDKTTVMIEQQQLIDKIECAVSFTIEKENKEDFIKILENTLSSMEEQQHLINKLEEKVNKLNYRLAVLDKDKNKAEEELKKEKSVSKLAIASKLLMCITLFTAYENCSTHNEKRYFAEKIKNILRKEADEIISSQVTDTDLPF